ncbi:MAG: PaaI family thioesterase, partial [Paludibacteraceae bacterium]|nr:PaaI family thioesterase [Paludibacteraceae bacterium]
EYIEGCLAAQIPIDYRPEALKAQAAASATYALRLMDELAGWVVTHKLHTCGVTSQLNTKFKQRVDTLGGPLKVRARLREMKRNLAFIDCEVLSADGTVCATAEAVYFTYPQEVAKTKFFLRTPDEAAGK